MQNMPQESGENNFLALLNFIVDPTVVVDEKGQILLVNDAFEDITGLNKTVVGKVFLDVDILTAESKAKMLENLKKRMQGLPVKPYEISFTDKNGETRDVEVKAKKISYTGQPADLVVFREITQRKRNEKRLKEYSEKMEALVEEKVAVIRDSEEKFRAMSTCAKDAIVVVDSEGEIVYWNPAAEKIFGYSQEEAVGKNVMKLLVPSRHQSFQQKFIELVQSSQLIQGEIFEFTALRKDGIEFPAELSAALMKFKNKSCLLGIVRDVSERKKSEEALRLSEAKYRELINGMNDTAWVIGLDANFIDVNDAAVKVLGYSREELLSMGPADIDNSLTKEQIRDLIRSMPADQIQVFETAHTTKDGKTIPVEISSSLVTYQGKQAILSIARDITERKYLEFSLRTSEEMFRAISTSAMDAIILLDDTGKITYWNPAAERIFGYTKEEVAGKKLDEVIIPKQYQGFHSKSAIQAFESGQIHKASIETKALRKNGTKVPIELSVAVLKIKDKKHLLGIIRDISERKKMEMTVREAEKRYRMLFNQAPLGILLIDYETARAVEFNEEAHRQLGYSSEEFAKLTVSDYEVIETPEETRARMKKVLREGRDEFETKHRTKTGEIRDVINTVQVIELADKKFFYLITRDITEQKKMENELKLERDKLEAVTENIGAGLTIISKDYRILWANSFLKQFNHDCKGKICYSTYNKLDRICPDCGVRKVFEHGVSFDRQEYYFKDPKGNPLWAELIVTPIKDKDGNIIAALELTVDITEKKLLQNKLKEYSQKLEQLVAKRTEELEQTQAKLVKAEKLAAIGELAGMIGHDLRNPLTGIKGATYYLKTKHGTQMGTTGQEMLKTIDKAIEHSNKIINDLLEYSSKLSLELTKTTPKLLLKNALAFIEVPERIQIIDAAKNKPKIKADIGNISKVFVNIINNAIDAMPKTGTLTITSKTAKDNVKIAFKDTGIGMTKETLSKLKLGFPLFTTKAKGMGFGLPICKRIVEAHGGKISLKSTLGKGTTITITIPINLQPMSEGEEKWIFSESVLRTMTTT
jgi:PAS domain S-box-containing protein